MTKNILLSLLLFSSTALLAQSTTTIAFGSCSDEDDTVQLWREVVQQKPELWIWLGDNIYADTTVRAVIKSKYDRQKNHPGYQKLLATCPVIGTWDDHDYGLNDSGKEYPMKKQSKELLLDFLDIPQDAEVRRHEGIYSSYTLGKGERKVKVILLDTRYFRDTLQKSTRPNERYRISDKGDMLGEEQWAWLENELQHSDAAINIIGSSVQFIPTQHGYEKWMNLSSSRERMLDLLKKYSTKKTFFISGDRHIAELSRLKVKGLPYALYDFTSSGLTHTWDAGTEENKYRIGELIKQKNFGIIRIDWSGNSPEILFEVFSTNGKKYLQYQFSF
jgi:alkaline phosphatase D